MRITAENPAPGARVFCNGIEFTPDRFGVLLADEEAGVVEAIRKPFTPGKESSIDRHVRHFQGTVKVLLTDR